VRGRGCQRRFDRDGELVLLDRQDRTRWDRAAIDSAEALTERAARRRPGRYQLQAAIAACHADATTWAGTDWQQIVVLYEMLMVFDTSPVTRLNRAVAIAQIGGPQSGLAELEQLADPLGRYHLWHAARARMLRLLGRGDEAREADAAALGLTANGAERSLLRRRLDGSA